MDLKCSLEQMNQIKDEIEYHSRKLLISYLYQLMDLNFIYKKRCQYNWTNIFNSCKIPNEKWRNYIKKVQFVIRKEGDNNISINEEQKLKYLKPTKSLFSLNCQQMQQDFTAICSYHWPFLDAHYPDFFIQIISDYFKKINTHQDDDLVLYCTKRYFGSKGASSFEPYTSLFLELYNYKNNDYGKLYYADDIELKVKNSNNDKLQAPKHIPLVKPEVPIKIKQVVKLKKTILKPKLKPKKVNPILHINPQDKSSPIIVSYDYQSVSPSFLQAATKRSKKKLLYVDIDMKNFLEERCIKEDKIFLFDKYMAPILNREIIKYMIEVEKWGSIENPLPLILIQFMMIENKTMYLDFILEAISEKFFVWPSFTDFSIKPELIKITKNKNDYKIRVLKKTRGLYENF